MYNNPLPRLWITSKAIIFFMLLVATFFSVFTKEVIFRGESRVSQIKFNIKDGEQVYLQKYQDLNGKITELWSINGSEVTKDEFRDRMEKAEKEEKSIEQELKEQKIREEEEKKRELIEKQKKEDEAFYNQTKLLALKKLINLELQNAENCFARLEKYSLDEYFIFDQDTFLSLDDFLETKNDLLGKARKLNFCSIDELSVDEMQDVLKKMEALPDKIENFFRKSIKNAINQCNDTKRLKELLALI